MYTFSSARLPEAVPTVRGKVRATVARHNVEAFVTIKSRAAESSWQAREERWAAEEALLQLHYEREAARWAVLEGRLVNGKQQVQQARGTAVQQQEEEQQQERHHQPSG
jgi:hypothetical protein